VRDFQGNEKRLYGPTAGYSCPRLEVRNFTAWWLFHLLVDPGDFTTPDRAPAQWAELREQMRALVRRELGDAPKK